MRNVKNDPLPRPVAEELGGKQRGLGQAGGHAAPLPRPRPAAPARRQPRGPPPARGGRGSPRVPGCGAPAHKSSLLPARPPAAAASPRGGKWRRPRARPLARGTHLRLAEKTSGRRRRRRGNGPAFPTAARRRRRARRAARENPDGSAGGRRLGGLREGYARAGNPMRGRAPRAARAAHWRGLLSDVRLTLSLQPVGAHPDPTGGWRRLGPPRTGRPPRRRRGEPAPRDGSSLPTGEPGE